MNEKNTATTILQAIAQSDMRQMDENVWNVLSATLELIQSVKPNDRTERDRIYALCVTHLQIAYSLFNTYVRKDDAR